MTFHIYPHPLSYLTIESYKKPAYQQQHPSMPSQTLIVINIC